MSAAIALAEDVAVLYVDPLGPYPQIVRDWYDAGQIGSWGTCTRA